MQMKCSMLKTCLLVLTTFLCSATTMANTPHVDLKPGVTKVDDIGLYDIGWRYRNGTTGSMPTGWSGHFEDSSGISCTSFGTQAGRQVFLLHPPWRGGTGVTDQTFHLTMPVAKRITLRFFIAMKEGETGPKKSDGATFRIYADGATVYDKNQTTSQWEPAAVDLSRFAGKSMLLTFETDPGTKDDPSFDYAFWGDRKIDAEPEAHAGRTAVTGPLISQKIVDYSRDYRPSSGVSPASATIYPAIHLSAHCKPASRSLFEGWSALLTDDELTSRVGRAPLEYGLGYGGYLDLVAPNGTTVRSDSNRVSVRSADTRSTGGITDRTIVYTLEGKTTTVHLRLFPAVGWNVKAELTSMDSSIAGVHFGTIGPVPFRRQISVPYYGIVQYFPDSGVFANVFIDHQRSHASRIDGVSALYEPLTDGSHVAVNETVYYALSPDIGSVTPRPANPPSPYRKQLADKIVLDTWGGHYADNAAFLEELATYRITHLLTIAHVWQHGGYDNMLPDVLPAYAPLGTNADMKTWAGAARNLGELFSLHENYVDFYPNAPSWNEQDVALDSHGQRVTAWLNEGTGIQSFAVAPDAILKYAKRITPQVQEAFEPNASYLDVHSAVPPWFHVDFRADHAGAGEYQTVWNAHRDLWSLFRTVHKGPVLGEGNNHWFWSGLLDAVEAQFGTGVSGNSGQTAPLFVDFDLAAIHPLQFNHGMGYLERWLPADFDAVWHTRIPSTKTLDQYRMQEVAYAHAGFVPAVFQNNLPFLWQEHHLISPLSSRYATAEVKSIEYERNGKLIGGGEEAATADRGAFDRVAITYTNGLHIWANSRDVAWQPAQNAPRLPQFGWLAISEGFQADTSLRRDASGKEVVTDYVRTAQSLFVNARSYYAEPDKPRDIRPTAGEFKQTAPRRFVLRYTWHTGVKIPEGYVIYIHVTGAGGTGSEKILFQPGSGLTTAPSTWKINSNNSGDLVETSLPTDLPDGEYSIRTGLYSPTIGDRLRLTGQSDETDRIIMGTIVVADSGHTIQFVQASQATLSPEESRQTEQRTEHINAGHTLVDFGEVATDASLLLEKSGPGKWLITPFPRATPIRFTWNALKLDPALRNPSITALDRYNKPLGTVNLVKTATGRWQTILGAIPGTTHYMLENK